MRKKDQRRGGIPPVLLTIIVFIAVVTVVSAQQTGDNGIHFERGLSWQQIKEKAKTEGKYIFMDCYATWCGPCHQMEREVYPRKEAGDFFNAHFVSVKVQLDQTSADLPEVQSWYADAATLKKDFQIGAYPTFLFFSPDGKAVHRMVGAKLNIPAFIKESEAALNPDTQYYTMLQGIPTHLNDSAYLSNAFLAAQKADDQEGQAKIADVYFGSLKAPLTQDNLLLIPKLVFSARSKAFLFLAREASIADTAMDNPYYAEGVLAHPIYAHDVAPLLKKEPLAMDWSKTAQMLRRKYPDLKPQFTDAVERGLRIKVNGLIQSRLNLGDTSLTENDFEKIEKQLGLKRRFPGLEWMLPFIEMQYFEKAKHWDTAIQLAKSLLQDYGEVIDPDGLNDLCWYGIFQHSSDPEMLKLAGGAMQALIDRHTIGIQDNYYDTYANILYKQNQTGQALVWENQAILAAKQANDDDDIAGFITTRQKMEKGERTW